MLAWLLAAPGREGCCTLALPAGRGPWSSWSTVSSSSKSSLVYPLVKLRLFPAALLRGLGVFGFALGAGMGLSLDGKGEGLERGLSSDSALACGDCWPPAGWPRPRKGDKLKVVCIAQFLHQLIFLKCNILACENDSKGPSSLHSHLGHGMQEPFPCTSQPQSFHQQGNNMMHASVIRSRPSSGAVCSAWGSQRNV